MNLKEINLFDHKPWSSGIGPQGNPALLSSICAVGSVISLWTYRCLKISSLLVDGTGFSVYIHAITVDTTDDCKSWFFIRNKCVIFP